MMRYPQYSTVRSKLAAGICSLTLLLTGCGSTTIGQMEWVQPHTQAPRVGNVYLLRGWGGMFSSGIDQMGDLLREKDVSAWVFQHSQCEDLAKIMAQRYKGVPDPEPICMIGHSFGSDDALIIARELDKVNVPVDLIVTLDPVDQKSVPKNVRLCINYWMPGVFLGTNFLRGIPLQQEPGGTGRVVNINLLEEGKELRDTFTNHISIDKAPKLHDAIVQHVLKTCPDRATWIAMQPQRRYITPTAAAAANEKARTAALELKPQLPPPPDKAAKR